MHSLPSRNELIEVLLCNPQNLLHIVPLGICRGDRVGATGERHRPTVQQIHDDLDAGMERVNVPRLVIDWENLEHDPIDPDTAHLTIIT